MTPRTLIVGAGSGTDVALALAKGAKHVDAVEIDPRIQQIGSQVNPNKPYDDPRVTVHINDGRAFLSGNNDKYDLILFALPDSLTLVSGSSQLRLESYLFTKQSIEAARDHLTDDGVFAMYNYYREPWLINRLAGTVNEVFGHDPCLDQFQGQSLAAITVGKDEANAVCATGAVWDRAAITPPLLLESVRRVARAADAPIRPVPMTATLRSTGGPIPASARRPGTPGCAR